ncbi:hypothetical protein N7462_007559 [Penicillium macrosclerotiorum]|uniref:uncharacterized protein n=1 Tax=Penicillium macrosclerotiorum TaxID=303699 RepID=UPI002548033E|nr:uncharacterized protein N7462_007559 [Penicillium macrosclerotiorum]KAJ5679315.1 hypothetical protein N7462_007559 [Penicillium macrosclerotiorum]
MVGVPYSKGCLLCVERRIRCDQSRPQCLHCLKYGVLCPGYERPRLFQDEGPRLKQRYEKKCALLTGNKVKLERPVVQSNGLIQKYGLAKASIDERIFPSLVHQSFVLQQPRMFKDFICAAFPTMFYHNEFRFGDGFTFPDWVMKHFGSKEYFDASVSSLSAEYLAYLTKDARLHHYSREKYSQALGAIRQALNSDETYSDSLLIAVILVSFYEMNIRTTPDGWVCHSRAVKHLMLKRGMKFHLSGAGRVCHFAYRPFLIAAAIYECEPCFLGEDNWQELAAILRTEDSQKQSQWSFYIDVYEAIFMELVKCPGYIKEAREMSPLRFGETSILAHQINTTTERLRKLSGELRSLLASDSQRKQGIIFRSFVGPEPDAFPETSPSLILNAAVNVIGILQQLLSRLTPPIEDKKEMPASGCQDALQSPILQRQEVVDYDCLIPQFRLTCELGGGIQKDDPSAFTWLDRIAGSMGLLGAAIIYENIARAS